MDPGARALLLSAVLWLAAIGCVPSTVVLQPPVSEQRVLGWLIDGETTRAELRERLGPPPVELNGGRLWAYDMQVFREEWLVVRQREHPANAQLVIGFDEHDRVAGHRLLGIGYRQP